jgi:hypothetical protein
MGDPLTDRERLMQMVLARGLAFARFRGNVRRGALTTPAAVENIAHS